MPAFQSSGARSMISAFRVGSPNSLKPRRINAGTSHMKDRQNKSVKGKNVKKTNVVTTNGFLALRSAKWATGIYMSRAVTISILVKIPNWKAVTGAAIVFIHHTTTKSYPASQPCFFSGRESQKYASAFPFYSPATWSLHQA